MSNTIQIHSGTDFRRPEGEQERPFRVEVEEWDARGRSDCPTGFRYTVRVETFPNIPRGSGDGGFGSASPEVTFFGNRLETLEAIGEAIVRQCAAFREQREAESAMRGEAEAAMRAEAEIPAAVEG